VNCAILAESVNYFINNWQTLLQFTGFPFNQNKDYRPYSTAQLLNLYEETWEPLSHETLCKALSTL